MFSNKFTLRAAFINTITILVHFAGSAQNIDSLWAVWEDTSQYDTIRFAALNDHIWNICYDHPDSALVLTDHMLEMAEEKEIHLWITKGLECKGICLGLVGDYAKATEYLKEGLRMCQNYDLKSQISSIYTSLGNNHYYQGNFLDALRMYEQSLAHEEIEAEKGNTYNSIGAIYYAQGDYSRALIYFNKYLNFAEEMGNQEGTANSYNNIGGIYFYQDNFTRALEYYQKALDVYKELSIQNLISTGYNNIGEAHLFQGDIENALKYLKMSAEMRESIQHEVGLSSTYENLGLAYARNGEFSEAKKYYLKSLDISKTIGLSVRIPSIYVSLGKLYMEMGDYAQAIKSCLQGLKASENKYLLMKQKEACECLYTSNKALGRGENALHYHEQLMTLRDSLDLRDTQKKLQQMEFAKQVEADSIIREKEKLEASLAFEREVNRQKARKNILMLVGIGIFLISGLLWMSRTTIKKQKDRSENLLLNILPGEVAEELKLKGESNAKDFDDVSVLFTDFKGFTRISENLKAQEILQELNIYFKAFDSIITSYRIEKIKTIGDAYMAAAGLHIPRTSSTKDVIFAALEMQEFMSNRKKENEALAKPFFEMRAGIHTGPVVAGIVGVKKFQYDIWGDTVNIASRIESSGEVGKVNISKSTYELIKDDPQFTFESRGKVQVKNKDDIEMYFVQKRKGLVS